MPTNSAPTLANLAGDSVTYAAGSAPVRLDAAGNAAVRDLDAFGFQVTRVGSAFAGGPLFVVEVPDNSGRVFVVEKNGAIRILDPRTGVVAATPFLDVSGQVATAGEQGLLGFALAPDFRTSGTFYVYLTNTSGDNEVRSYRTMTSNPEQADPATANRILLLPHPGASNHNGGWIAFGPDGHLYIATGDGAVGANAQSLNSPLGKILRIDPSSDAFPGDPDRDYSIPAGNPFAGATPGLDEIWAYGLRNPFRASFDALTGDLYIGDVGENRIEEIDLMPAGAGGANFGWNVREGSLQMTGPDSPSFTPPVAEYSHGSGPFQGDSVTGGLVYRGPIAALDGHYLFGDFFDQLWSVPASSLVLGSTLPSSAFTLRETAFAPNAGTINQITSFAADSRGNIYITDLGGEVFRVEPSVVPNFAGGQLSAAITANGIAAEDRLGFATGTAVTLSNGTNVGSQVRVDGVVVGAIAPGGTGASGEPLIVLFSSGATAARVSSLIQAVAYSNPAADPTAGTRTVTIRLDDGAGTAAGGQAVSVVTTNVTVVDTGAAVPRNDGFATNESEAIAGNVFADNGSGADADPNGPALQVAAVNGSAAAVNSQVMLPSGALLTLNSNGSLSYAPNGAFGATPADGSGASNSPGFDSFTYTLTGGGTATVTIRISGIDNNDVLIGSGSADMLAGGVGADTLVGGAGNDTYFVDNPGDAILEGTDGGLDTIFSSVDYALPAGVHVETLSSANQGGSAAQNLTGNELGNALYGTLGANILDGSGGRDVLVGFDGDDTYRVDPEDDIVEAAGRGFDSAYARGDYIIRPGVHVELLSAANQGSSSSQSLTGNEFANLLYGTLGDNRLDGGGGADTLVGFAGNDTYFATADDSIVEAADGGWDTLFATGDFRLGAGVHVETLSSGNQGGTSPQNLTGNELANALYGNQGDNRLDGGGGADTLVGFAGHDIYFAGADDTIIEAAGAGSDTLFATGDFQLAQGVEIETLSSRDQSGSFAQSLAGNGLANLLYGNQGINRIDGGGGNDVLIGFGGADVFAYTSALAAANIDTIFDFQSGSDTIELSQSVFAGLAKGALPASAFRLGNAAQDPDDRIIYDPASGALLFDPDGSGGSASVQFGHIYGAPTIAASDFTVI